MRGGIHVGCIGILSGFQAQKKYGSRPIVDKIRDFVICFETG